jgi:hypothetical protein
MMHQAAENERRKTGSDQHWQRGITGSVFACLSSLEDLDAGDLAKAGHEYVDAARELLQAAAPLLERAGIGIEDFGTAATLPGPFAAIGSGAGRSASPIAKAVGHHPVQRPPQAHDQ